MENLEKAYKTVMRQGVKYYAEGPHAGKEYGKVRGSGKQEQNPHPEGSSAFHKHNREQAEREYAAIEKKQAAIHRELQVTSDVGKRDAIWRKINSLKQKKEAKHDEIMSHVELQNAAKMRESPPKSDPKEHSDHAKLALQHAKEGNWDAAWTVAQQDPTLAEGTTKDQWVAWASRKFRGGDKLTLEDSKKIPEDMFDADDPKYNSEEQKANERKDAHNKWEQAGGPDKAIHPALTDSGSADINPPNGSFVEGMVKHPKDWDNQDNEIAIKKLVEKKTTKQLEKQLDLIREQQKIATEQKNEHGKANLDAMENIVIAAIDQKEFAEDDAEKPKSDEKGDAESEGTSENQWDLDSPKGVESQDAEIRKLSQQIENLEDRSLKVKSVTDHAKLHSKIKSLVEKRGKLQAAKLQRQTSERHSKITEVYTPDGFEWVPDYLKEKGLENTLQKIRSDSKLWDLPDNESEKMLDSVKAMGKKDKHALGMADSGAMSNYRDNKSANEFHQGIKAAAEKAGHSVSQEGNTLKIKHKDNNLEVHADAGKGTFQVHDQHGVIPDANKKSTRKFEKPEELLAHLEDDPDLDKKSDNKKLEPKSLTEPHPDWLAENKHVPKALAAMDDSRLDDEVSHVSNAALSYADLQNSEYTKDAYNPEQHTHMKNYLAAARNEQQKRKTSKEPTAEDHKKNRDKAIEEHGQLVKDFNEAVAEENKHFKFMPDYDRDAHEKAKAKSSEIKQKLKDKFAEVNRHNDAYETATKLKKSLSLPEDALDYEIDATAERLVKVMARNQALQNAVTTHFENLEKGGEGSGVKGHHTDLDHPVVKAAAKIHDTFVHGVLSHIHKHGDSKPKDREWRDSFEQQGLIQFGGPREGIPYNHHRLTEQGHAKLKELSESLQKGGPGSGRTSHDVSHFDGTQHQKHWSRYDPGYGSKVSATHESISKEDFAKKYNLDPKHVGHVKHDGIDYHVGINTQPHYLQKYLQKGTLMKEQLIKSIQELGPEGIRAKMSEFTEPEQVLLLEVLEEMKKGKPAIAFDKEADGAKAKRSKTTDRTQQEEVANDDADEELVKDEAVEQKHQGDETPEGKEGQMIKSFLKPETLELLNKSQEAFTGFIERLKKSGKTDDQIIEACGQNGLDVAKTCETLDRLEKSEKPKPQVIWADDNKLIKANTQGRNFHFSVNAFETASEKLEKSKPVNPNLKDSPVNDLLEKGLDRSINQTNAERLLKAHQEAVGAKKLGVVQSFSDVDMDALFQVPNR